MSVERDLNSNHENKTDTRGQHVSRFVEHSAEEDVKDNVSDENRTDKKIKLLELHYG